jgi:arginine:ornithine antiporter / lysine permease
MFVAAGLKNVLLVAVLFVPGTILYFWARREQNARMFTPAELVIFGVTVVAGVIGVAGLVTGVIIP